MWVVAPPHERLARLSRYTRRTLPWSGDGPEEQVHHLLGFADEHRLDGWVVFPTTTSPRPCCRAATALEGCERRNGRSSRYFR